MTGAWTLDILRLMSRILRHGFRFFATLFGIIALLLMIAAWRLAYVPLHSTTLTPYLEKAFSRLIPGSVVKVGQSTLVWDNNKQVVSLSCSDVHFTTEAGAQVASLQSAEFKLKPWRVLSGGILPQELTAKGAQFWMVRDTNGLVSFGLPNEDAVEEKSDFDEAMDFKFLQFIADEIANPKLQHTIGVTDVVFYVKDKQWGADWSATVPEITLTHNKSTAKGVARLDLREKDKSSALQLYYDFEPEKKLHNVTLHFQDIKPSAFATQESHFAPLKIAEFPVSGDVTFSTDRDLNISKVMVSLDGGKGLLNDASLWEKPRSLERLTVRANYDKEKDALQVSKAEIDFGGPRLNLTLDAKIPPPKDLIWLNRNDKSNAFTMKITLDDLPMDEYASVWPKPIIPDARNWIATSLSKGVFTHGDVTIRGKVNLNDLENIVLESGGGKIYAKGGRVNYLAQMPDIENVDAEATFDLDHMDILIKTGNTGSIKIQPFTLVMDRFQEDVQHILIPIKLAGPVNEVLKVLDSPPLGYAKAIGLSSADSAGQVEGTLTLRMPLLDSLLLKDIDVRAQAKISGFAAEKLVPGIKIGAGDLSLDLTQDGFTLKGTAGLNNVASQIQWESVFDTQRTKKPLHDATITATLKGSEWDSFYGLGTLAKVEGETPATIKYTNVRPGFSKVSGQIGLKQASVRMKDIGWNKPAGEVAQLSFALEMPSGKNMVFRSIELQGPTTKVKGTAELDYGTGKLLAMNFKPFVLGRSNATVSYTRPLDVTKPLSIVVEGESFDMNGIDEMEKEAKAATPTPKPEEGADDPEKKRPKNYSVRLVKLFTSEDGFMGSMRGQLSRDHIGWKELDIWGVAQGSTPVTIKLAPEQGKSVFRMTSDNFGVALQGLGFGSGVKGGKLHVTGESTVSDPRTIQGGIRIDSFVVNDLPVLARLLSAVSPFGFMDLITGDASFDKLRAHFKWHGDEVELNEVRAAGSVVGINLDGKLNIESGEANLSGTLVPFSFVNSIIGSIPLLGDVITGGSGGGIIAASFSVRGALSDPNISVNPVSLLTPGILRSLFFSNGDGGETQPQQPEAPAHEAQPSQNNLSTKK